MCHYPPPPYPGLSTFWHRLSKIKIYFHWGCWIKTAGACWKRWRIFSSLIISRLIFNDAMIDREKKKRQDRVGCFKNFFNKIPRIRHLYRVAAVLSCHRCLNNTRVEKWTAFKINQKSKRQFSQWSNRATHIRHLCRKSTVLRCYRCLNNTRVEKWTTFKINQKSKR
jgi:hypothetical protein